MFMMSERSSATMPWEYQDEYATSPQTSVLCTDQMPLAPADRSLRLGRSSNCETCTPVSGVEYAQEAPRRLLRAQRGGPLGDHGVGGRRIGEEDREAHEAEVHPLRAGVLGIEAMHDGRGARSLGQDLLGV